MNDTLTVLRKELREIIGDRTSRRGSMVQSIILVVVVGVLYPMVAWRTWVAASPLAVVYFFFLPGMVSVTVAADAFAGERERKTLETLLATPLRERSILAGKVAAALLFSLTVSAVAFLVAVVTVNAHKPGPGLFLPAPALVAAAAGGTLASALVLASIAVLMSMKIPVARSVQQVASLLSFGLFGTVVFTWTWLRVTLTFRNVFVAEGIVFLAGVLMFEIARVVFRRDQFFDKR